MEGFTDRALGLSRFRKNGIVILVDSLVCALSVWLAFYLRIGEFVQLSDPVIIATIFAIVLAIPIFYFVGLYSVILRYATLTALAALTRAVLIFGILYALLFAVMGIPGVPRTVGLIQPILLFLGAGLSRATVSYVLGGARNGRRAHNAASNILIYGAGAAGQQLAQAVSASSQMRVIGFVDDNPELQNRLLNNVRVYRPDQLEAIVRDRDIAEILLAFPSASRARRTEIIRSLCKLDVRVRTLPGLIDIAHGHVQVTDIKPLEIEDLLGRDVVAPDSRLLGLDIIEKTVLITGAGGSIGSELCRQIIKMGPTTMLLVESTEFALYSIHQDLTNWIRIGERSDISVVPLLGSVRDDHRMREIIGTWRPHTIYHAAAYKHVPLVEHNPIEGVRNNVMGTITTARVAIDFGVTKFVLVSTDKAVRPTNIMGTSKRLAEMALQALAEIPSSTCFTMVRFGNVLGSSGSVFPLFRKQIAEGGPVTITHPDITRYFMTIPEAAQLVIQAGAMATGGEVFLLDMGEPVRIIDLARNMIELSGMTLKSNDNPYGDIEISVVGLRPGEKLYEELLIGDNAEPTGHPRVMKANDDFIKWLDLEGHLTNLSIALDSSDVAGVDLILRTLVREYRPMSGPVDWITLQRKATLSLPA